MAAHRHQLRTTHEILAWSSALLGEGNYDDLDEGLDVHDFAGYHSLVHGPQPPLDGARSTQAQMQAMAKQVREWTDGRVGEEEIGVTARRHHSSDAARQALRQAGVLAVLLQQDTPLERGVRIGTMHRLKGLEFATSP